MRFCWRRLLILSLAMCAWGIQTILAQQAAKPLTERELVYLLEKKVSSSALADMVQSYGVTFAADADVLDRLKRAGANSGLLETIQRRAKMLNLQVETLSYDGNADQHDKKDQDHQSKFNQSLPMLFSPLFVLSLKMKFLKMFHC